MTIAPLSIRGRSIATLPTTEHPSRLYFFFDFAHILFHFFLVAFLNLSNLDLFSNLYLIASYKSLPSSLAYMSIKLGNFRSLHLLSIIYALFVLRLASPRTSSVTRGRKLKPPLPMTKP